MKTTRYDEGLIRLAEEVAIERFPEAGPFVCRVFTDGLAFSVRGFKAITLGSLDDDKIIKNYHWHTDVPENVDYSTMDRAERFVERLVEKVIEAGTG